MARPRVAEGKLGLQIWRVVANILNVHGQPIRGSPSDLGLGEGLNTAMELLVP
jgi:hypothetical protein